MAPSSLRNGSWLASLAAGVLCLALASRSGSQADLVSALGWCLVASVGLSMLLSVGGRRALAVVQLALVTGAGWAAASGQGHPGLWAGVVLGAAGAMVQLLTAQRWPGRGDRFARTPSAELRTDTDIWKAMDAGIDPTDDGFGANLAPQERMRSGATERQSPTEPVAAPQPPTQEDR